MTQATTLKPTSSFRYAVGMFGTSIPINMFKTFALTFYVDMLGLPSSRFALVLSIYAIVDAIDNPLYGYLSDHTRSRWGRRRPWLVIGTPLLIVCFVLFYSTPDWIAKRENYLFVYLLLTYILTGTLDSLMNANYGALFPELFPQDSQRAKTNALRQVFQLVAMGISVALTPMITGKLGYQKTAIVYGILALAVVLYCAFGCHENPQNQELEKPQLLRTVWDLVRSSKFWIFGIGYACYGAGFSLIISIIPMYVKYVLKLESAQTTILMGSFLGMVMLGIALWTLLAKNMDLMKSWRLSLLIMSLGFIPLYWMRSLGGVIAAAAIIAAGGSGVLRSMDVVGAKIMDDDFRRHGIRREGMISSAMGMLSRLNGLFVALALLIGEKGFGYVSGDIPGPNPAAAMKFLMIVFPCVTMLLGFVFACLLRFPKDAPTEAAEENVS